MFAPQHFALRDFERRATGISDLAERNKNSAAPLAFYTGRAETLRGNRTGNFGQNPGAPKLLIRQAFGRCPFYARAMKPFGCGSEGPK
jgi:hypothetical protein